MTNLFTLFGFFALTFLASFGVACLLVAWRKRASRLTLEPGTRLRLRGPSGVYRATVVCESALGWVIGAPVQRDHYVPLRPGELLVAEAADESGAVLFRTEVLGRDMGTHEISIRRPARFSKMERREAPGARKQTGLEAILEGEEARVVDLSEQGARVATRAAVGKGERVRLDIAGRDEPVFGWVLESLPGGLFGYQGSEVRLRFES